MSWAAQIITGAAGGPVRVIRDLWTALQGESGGGTSESEISQLFLDYSPAVWGGLLLILISLYLNLYFDKYFRELKIKGSKYVDNATYDFGAVGLKGIATGLILILFFYVEYYMLPASSYADQFRVIWEAITEYIVVIVSIPIIFFLFRMLVLLLHGFIQARTPVAEEGDTIRRGISIGELLLKYTLYIIAAVISYLILLTKTGSEERLQNIEAELWSHTNEMGLIFVLLLGVYILDRIILPSIVEDMKKRGYSPQMLEGIQWGGSWTIRGMFILFLLYTLLVLFGLENIGTIFVAFLFLIIIVSVAVVLASPLRNIVSGMIIISNRPFDEGDRVRLLGDMECTVKKQTLIFTHVRTLDGQPHLIPNEKVLAHPIVNLSRTPTRRLTLEMDFHTSLPNKKMKGLLVKSAFSLKEVDRKRPPKVVVTSIEGDILTYQLTINIDKGKSTSDTRSKLLCRIQEELLASGISEPLSPQGDVRAVRRRGGGDRGPKKMGKGY